MDSLLSSSITDVSEDCRHLLTSHSWRHDASIYLLLASLAVFRKTCDLYLEMDTCISGSESFSRGMRLIGSVIMTGIMMELVWMRDIEWEFCVHASCIIRIWYIWSLLELWKNTYIQKKRMKIWWSITHFSTKTFHRRMNIDSSISNMKKHTQKYYKMSINRWINLIRWNLNKYQG